MSAAAHVPLTEFEALAVLGVIRDGGEGLGHTLAVQVLVTLLDEQKRALKAERRLAAIRTRLFAKTGRPGPSDEPWERSVWRLTAPAGGAR